MDTLRVDVQWGDAHGDVVEAIELLREMADRLETRLYNGALSKAFPHYIMSTGGIARLANARIIRDRR